MNNPVKINSRFTTDFKQRHSFLYGFISVAMLSAMVILQGCATYSTGFAKIENATANRDLDGALKSLDELKLTGADEVLHHLNKGTLLRLKENYAESNKHLDAAKLMMEKLLATSVTEQAGSATLNDTVKAYEGLPSEQMMLYSFAALNYLQMGEIDEAAVEARQFDVKQGLIAKKNANAKYLSGAFVRYLNGMVYEAAGERDSARIEMQKAVDGYIAQNSGFGVPPALIADLARVKADQATPSEVVFILHNGLGPSLNEVIIRVANPKPEHGSSLLSLAVPKFALRSVPVARVELKANAFSANSEVVEDINDIAERSLNDRLPIITARAVSRMVLKNTAAGETKKKSNDLGVFGLLAGIALDVGATVSERADTRSWSLLPGNINMARLALPQGNYDVTATYFGQNGNIIGSRVFKNITVKPGKKSFVSDYFLNPTTITR